MHINLLPRKLSLGLLVLRRLRQWACVWAALAVLGMLHITGDHVSVNRMQSSLDSLATRVRPLQRLQQETTNVKAQLERKQQESNVLQRICSPDHSLALLAVIGDAANSTANRVQVDRMLWSSSEQKSPTKKENGEVLTTNQSMVSLNGIADSDVALATFVESLRRASVFYQVELKSAQRHIINEQDSRQFQIECRFVDRT